MIVRLSVGKTIQRRTSKGFTLVELAVVMAIVGLLLGGIMATLNTVAERRGWEDTQRRLDYARDLLFSFAIVNSRLPCPASGLTGDEAFATGSAATGGGSCTAPYGGYLPAKAIGFQPISPSGAALDGWGNPIRYAVSATPWGLPTADGRFTRKHVATDTKVAWSVSTTPADLVICSAATASATSCDGGISVVNANTVVAIVFSTGKNGATGGTGTNESRNLDSNALFVSRTPDSSGATGGEFDDLLAWIPVGQLYGRLIAAGVLP